MVSKYLLLITAVYPPEPVVSARLSKDLYNALKAQGREVRVLHPKPTRPNGFDFKNIRSGEDEIVADSYTCPQSSLLGRFRESFSLGQICAKYITENHEEIACIYANAWPLASQYLLVKAAKKYGIPVAMHVQDVYPESLTNKLPKLIGGVMKFLLLPMDKYILKNSNKVIAISEYMKDYLVTTRDVDDKKISVVINWQDEAEFLDFEKRGVKAAHDIFTFMYMGNIGPVAGVDLLIDAFTYLNDSKTRLVIAGSGSMKEALKEKALGNANIEFWDVPNGKVPEIQSMADVMMLPIKKGAASSSIPSKLPAYMFSAKPIIGCMDGDSYTADAIRASMGGFVVEPENVQVLKDMMEEVASMGSDELTKIGKYGQEYALIHYAKSSNLTKLLQVVEEVL